MDSSRIEVYAPVIIRLLKEVISIHDQREWSLLLEHEYVIREYLNRIGLEVYINPVDGYAFARQPELNPDEVAIKLPRLTRNQPMTMLQTLLLILLREKLDEFSSQPQESNDLILSRDDLHRLLEPFMQERNDARKLSGKIDTTINRLTEMGFLKVLSPDHPHDFIVQRILKAKVTPEVIGRLKEQIMEQSAHAVEAS
jgi:hypothetical protein